MASENAAKGFLYLATCQTCVRSGESMVLQHPAWRNVVKDKDHLDLIQQSVSLASASIDETNKVVSRQTGTSSIWALYPRDRDDNELFSISMVCADVDDERLGIRTGKKLVTSRRASFVCRLLQR